MISSSEISEAVNEFSRPVEADTFQHGTSEKTFKATKDECEALKQRFGIEALKHLSAKLGISRRGSGGRIKITVNGRLDAAITQNCVITLDPFDTAIKSQFQTTFDARDFEELGDIDVDLQVDDQPEPIIDGIIDLGELISQSLALEIDLHPRKPRTESVLNTLNKSKNSDISDDIITEHPFAALQKLKIKSKD
jgi:uncharacterized metal-binding protein YceD (DUF177 family)